MDINPETLELPNLPSVPMEMKSQLPQTPCIYFAIDSSNKVQYIGQATKLRNRWYSHEKLWQLKAFDGIKIAWLEVQASQLSIIEKELIKYFDPPLNYIKDDPERTARVLELRKQGKSHRLIASELDIHEKQVRRILKRFKDLSLNKVLGKDGKLYSLKSKSTIKKKVISRPVTKIEELKQELFLKEQEIEQISHELLILSEENAFLKAQLENFLNPPF